MLQEDIADLMAGLRHLHTISLHLDFPDIPEPSAWTRRGVSYLSPRDLVNQERVLFAHAQTFARALNRSNYDIRLMGRGDGGGTWFLFRVSGGGGANSLRIDLDHDYREVINKHTGGNSC